MEAIWQIGVISLWVVVLLNLLITIRIIRWFHVTQDMRRHIAVRDESPPLAVGSVAPPFRARTLAGELRTRDGFAGRATVFVFVSPHCGSCRTKLADLQTLSVSAKERAQIELVLVSDSGIAETLEWINLARDEDKVEVKMPVLTAPLSNSDFLSVYNPQGYLPYFCLVDDQGTVRARDPLGMGEWKRLEREWMRRASRDLFDRRTDHMSQ